CPGSPLRSFDLSRPTCADCFSRAKRRVASADLDHCEHPAGRESTFLRPYGTPTTCIFDRQRYLLQGWGNSGCEKRYLIFARIPSISCRRKARKVWPFTLPSEPTLRMNALIVSSSGASNTTTAS